MSFKKLITGLILSMLFSNSVAGELAYDKGLTAYNMGKYKTALAELKPLAEDGIPIAQNILGTMYNHGKGVPQNDNTAVKWFTKAAKQGHAGSQWYLGKMYEYGTGVTKSDTTAAWWYIKAAPRYIPAQYDLGRMYALGNGVPQNNRLAYMWLNIASYKGNTEATVLKASLAKRMTQANISKAQDMSSRCVESNYTDC